MLQAIDFTTAYIAHVNPSDAAALYASGRTHAAIGFDSTPDSGQVLSALLASGFTWDAYRFLYWTLDVSQVQSCIDGIHAYSPDVPHLPGYLWLDAEEQRDGSGNLVQAAPANPSDYCHRVMDYVEARGITPTDIVRPGIYTRKSWWEQYCAGYDEPAQRGWALWTSEPARQSDPDSALLYGGWQRSQVVAVQTDLQRASAIGEVDYNLFRPRGAAALPDYRAALVKLQAEIAAVLA